MAEVEIVIAAKNMAKAAFASAEADTTALKRRAEELSASLRRAQLAAVSAGSSAREAMLRASAAGTSAAQAQLRAKQAQEQAAASAKANAEAQDKLAKGEITAEEAGKAQAKAQDDAAKANIAGAKAAQANERAQLAQARAAQANERAQLAQGRAAGVAAEEQDAAAALNVGALGKMQTGFKRLAGVGKTALFGVVAGTVAVGYESVKASTKFDAAMKMIQTQAGASQQEVNDLSKGVLKLAGKVGQDPDSLAEAAYHVESNFRSMGISTSKALNIVKVAAEGARVGNADLVDVTNALTAAVASGIPGVQNMDQAMGMLNATVGAGDMKMQDLADAFGTGMLATVKGFGISIQDVGAALAVFGDNNIRGAKAGTEFRMAVEALAKPAQGGADALKRLGLSTDSLAKDMQKGGLKLAMQDLVDRMKKAGISAKQQGEILTEAFGKKAGTGINILAGQFDRLSSKYPELEKGAHGFGNAWKETQKTFSTQVHKVEDALKAMAIQIGEKVTPALSTMLGWLTKHTGALEVFAGVIGGVVLTAITAYAIEMGIAAVETIAATWPILLVVAALGALAGAVVYAYKHFKPFREAVNAAAHVLKVAWKEAERVFSTVMGVIRKDLAKVEAYFRSHSGQIKKIWSGVWKELQHDWKSFENGPLKDIQHGLKNVEQWWKKNGAEITRDVKSAWKTISLDISIAMELIKSVIKVAWTWIKIFLKTIWDGLKDAAKQAWDLIKDTITTVMHGIHNTINLVLDLIHGRWGRAWSDLKKLTSQGMSDITHLISNQARDFGNLLVDAGRNVVMGLIHGIESEVGAVGSAMSNIASMIRSYLPHSPAKRGPLSGEGSPDKSGAKISAMLADGMASGTHLVAAATDGMAAAAVVHASAAGWRRAQTLISHVSKAMDGKRRAAGRSSSGSVSDGYVGDLTWRASGVQYTVGGAGRMTGPVSAAGGTSGSTQVSGGGSGGGHLTMQFNPMLVEFDFRGGGGSHFEHAMIQWMRQAIRVRGGNVQTVLGH